MTRSRSTDNLFRHLLFQRLKTIRDGQLVIVESGATREFGQSGDDQPEPITLTVHHPRFYRRAVLGGGLGVAESLGEGDWSSSDLTGLVRLFVRNLAGADVVNGPLGGLRHQVARVGHQLARNTVGRARRNIWQHYDLSNDFFRLFLDETLTYSCGLFRSPQDDLQQASVEKIDRACRLLDLQPGDHLLEIGTGWGGLALHAARHYGCRVTTTTISARQHELAAERIAESGVADRIRLLFEDYRSLQGQYDKLVSIEMIEAVGHQYYDTFFRKCGQLLKPDGEMLLQAITIVDYRFAHHRRTVDFIKQYIFPGGCLPSTTALLTAMSRTSRMRLVHLADFAEHYATTLRTWRQRFRERLPEIRQLGFDDRFLRIWEYYFAYCEAAFLERHVNVSQMLFAQPGSRVDPLSRLGEPAGQAEHAPVSPLASGPRRRVDQDAPAEPMPAGRGDRA